MLKIEVIKFEAQDVITASCICNKGFEKAHAIVDGKHIIGVGNDWNNLKVKECHADKHVCPTYPDEPVLK